VTGIRIQETSRPRPLHVQARAVGAPRRLHRVRDPWTILAARWKSCTACSRPGAAPD